MSVAMEPREIREPGASASSAAEQSTKPPLTRRDVAVVAWRLVAVYALFQGVEPTVNLIRGVGQVFSLAGADQDQAVGQDLWYWVVAILPCAAYLVVAILLWIDAPRLANWLLPSGKGKGASEVSGDDVVRTVVGSPVRQLETIGFSIIAVALVATGLPALAASAWYSWLSATGDTVDILLDTHFDMAALVRIILGVGLFLGARHLSRWSAKTTGEGK